MEYFLSEQDRNPVDHDEENPLYMTHEVACSLQQSMVGPAILKLRHANSLCLMYLVGYILSLSSDGPTPVLQVETPLCMLHQADRSILVSEHDSRIPTMIKRGFSVCDSSNVSLHLSLSKGGS